MREYKSKEIIEIIEQGKSIEEKAIVIGPIIFKDTKIKKLCFSDITFIEPVEFKNVEIEEVVFNNCIFKNKVIFSDSKLLGNVSFDDSIFQNETFFIRTIFGSNNSSSEHQILFSRTHFLKNVHFTGACFNLHTHFNEAFFFKSSDFSEAQFKREAIFIDTIFEDRTIFCDSTFFDKAFFFRTEFRHSANFNLVSFNTQASFIETHLERVDFRVKLFKNLNLSYTTIRNTEMTKENIQGEIEQEKKGDYAEAREIYIMLKNNFNTIGRYDDQSWAFLKEKEMERKKYLKNKQYGKYFLDLFIYHLYGYGEKPLYTIRASIVTIFLFSLIYWYSGSIIPNMDSSFFTIPFKLKFSDALYFSVVTFTTVGYGDWYPNPNHWIKYIVMLEAFVGIFMIGLFVFSITRRTANR